jgi:uncharacterized protein
MTRIAIAFVRFYQITVSSFLGFFGLNFCRFKPTCSEYSILALNKYGFIVGTKKTIKRRLRCNPFSNHSYIDYP